MMRRRKTIRSILSIELEPGRIRSIVAARNGSGAKIRKSHETSLSLPSLTAEPELLGQEIRNHLNQAGIRETQCVLCLPLQWVLKHRMESPDLSADDRWDLITLTAEREFPYPPDELSISAAEFETPDKQRYLMITAVPITYLLAMETACKTANIKPISITFAYPRVQRDDPRKATVHLHKREKGIDFFILQNNEIITLRWFENDWEANGEYTDVQSETILRELRITLNQLPPSLQASIRAIQLSGPESWCTAFRQPLQEALDRVGSKLTVKKAKEADSSMPSGGESGVFLPLAGSVDRFLTYQKSYFEYLPPKISKWKKALAPVTSRGNFVFGGAAAAVILAIFGLFIYQYFTLTNLESRWSQIEEQVTEIETLQTNVKLFRPWFSDSFPTLHAMQTLTRAFPEEGSVWAKSVQIENIGALTCSGSADNNKAWLTVVEQLNNSDRVSELQVQQVQGERPIQFAFSYFWIEG